MVLAIFRLFYNPSAPHMDVYATIREYSNKIVFELYF